jgi:DNA-directed RNA polymerase subunit RPC12/RpoP
MSVGEEALGMANMRLGLAGQDKAGFVCARCYRAAAMTDLLERAPCRGCGGHIFVRLAGPGRVRRICFT